MSQILNTAPASPLTETQVKIHPTRLNFSVVFECPHDKFYDYVDKIRKESSAWKKVQHYPLVSFVNLEGTEEIVFANQEALPKEPTQIKDSAGRLIANLT